MNQPQGDSSSRVEALRLAFDGGFASPARPPDADLEQFLAIRCAGRPFALRVAELTRVEARREIVPLPVETRNLLGIAGIQGRLVPIYSLGSLLGLGADSADWRWIAVCGLAETFGLAFDSIDACFATPRTTVLAVGMENSIQGTKEHAVRFAGEVRNVVQVRSLEAVLRNAASGETGAIEES